MNALPEGSELPVFKSKMGQIVKTTRLFLTSFFPSACFPVAFCVSRAHTGARNTPARPRPAKYMEEQQVTPPGLVPRTSVTLNDDDRGDTTPEEGDRPSTSTTHHQHNHHGDDVTSDNENLDTTRDYAGLNATARQLLVVEAEEEGEGEGGDDGEGGAELYDVVEDDGSGDAGGSGEGGGGGELFSASDLVYEYHEGDECRICLADERKERRILRNSTSLYFYECLLSSSSSDFT